MKEAIGQVLIQAKNIGSTLNETISQFLAIIAPVNDLTHQKIFNLRSSYDEKQDRKIFQLYSLQHTGGKKMCFVTKQIIINKFRETSFGNTSKMWQVNLTFVNENGKSVAQILEFSKLDYSVDLSPEYQQINLLSQQIS
jgi:hypothetical protein